MAARPLPWPRRLRRRGYWLLTLLVLAGAPLMPLAWGRRSGRLLAGLALRLRPQERRLARANLQLVYPEMSQQQRDRLLRDSAAALGGNFHDMLVADRLREDEGRIAEAPPPPGETGDFGGKMAELLGRGRGLLLLTGHFGCWELLGAWVARKLQQMGQGPLAVVTGTVHNPAVDRLLQDRRRGLGMTVLPRDEGLAPLVAHLRRGKAAAVLLDQNLRVPSRSVRFCGAPAPTPEGPAKLALKLGVPVLPVALAQDAQGVHRVYRLAPLVTAGGDGYVEREVDGLLAACNAALETFLRRNPAQWVWFHDRWALGERRAFAAERG